MLKVNTYFDKSLKNCLVNSEEARFIYLNNFEVEEKWTSNDHYKMPTISLGNSERVVNRMEELCLHLASENDYLLLKDQVDVDYFHYLKEQGFKLPNIIVVNYKNPSLNITESILECELTITKLKGLKGASTYLMPFGTSDLEEKLSETVGIPLSTPSSDIYKQVNSKIYGRNVNETTKIQQIPGFNCNSIQDLEDGFNNFEKDILNGEKIVIKDALGVSGKGITIIGSHQKFAQYLKLLQRSLKRNPSKSINMVMEKWIDKQTEVNYQFIVSTKGEVLFNFVKESIVKDSVHQGHITPSNLTNEQIEILRDAANKIGRELHKSGYFGIVGVDAIVCVNGVVYPNMEINARFNMSTYQSVIQERYLDDKVALAKKVDLKLNSWKNFKKIESYLGDILFESKRGTGLLITNFATLNAAYQEEGVQYSGRLYYMVIENNNEDLISTDEIFKERISKIEEYVCHA
ncbi:ATP-grasp domain-containing protein [Sporosarcina sp. 6E9]|uniref:ATP-grasp domain-containing protein n=1 Tax=Sporosarcina sp. 6E9 TaxID=2819235 RepID=UPI001B313993|nr:ATP-grasp domain-containing protein [Sporosarcina sp. 6E9]